MFYIVVGIGGIFGSIARYSISKLVTKYNRTIFPWATFTVNIIGALLLGAVSAININDILYLLAVEGFVGAFTTFSTFMFEGISLINNKRYLMSAAYIVISMTLGILGFGLSYIFITELFL